MPIDVGRRAQVLEAAIEIVAERGLRALTHRSVDEAAGVPAGTTSNHFRTRDDLLVELATEILRTVMPEMEKAIPPAAELTVETLLGQIAVGTGKEGLAWCRLAVMSFSVPAIQQVVASAQRRFVGNFAAAMRAAGSPDPERHVMHVTALLVGVQMRQLCDPVTPNGVRYAFETLLGGLLSGAQPVDTRRPATMVELAPEWAPPADQLTRKDRVLDAAVEVLAEHGTRGLTHRAVDAAADLVEGTAKNYCRTQESLRRAALDRATTRAIVATPRRLGAPPETEQELTARLVAIYRATVAPAEGERSSWQTELKAMLVLCFEAATAAEYVPLLRRGMRIWRESFASWLDAHGAADPWSGGEALEVYLFGMILMTYGIPELDLDPTEAIAPMVTGLLHPKGPTAPDADRTGSCRRAGC